MHRSLSVSLSTLLVMLGVFGFGVTTDPLHAEETAQIEERLADIESRRIDVELQRRELDRQLMELRLETDAERARLERIRLEDRARRAEEGGLVALAALIRREGDLRLRERAVFGEMREIETRAMRELADLEADGRWLQLDAQEAQRLGETEKARSLQQEHEELAFQRQERQEEIDVLRDGVEAEARELRVRLAEVQLELAEERGDGEALVDRLRGHLERTRHERAAFEVDRAFEEVDRELVAEFRRLRRERWATEQGSLEGREIAEALRRVSEDRRKVASSRRTSRAEAEIDRLRASVERHLESLEGDAAEARDQAERDALEDEIARLRNALIAALESTLGSGSG